MYTHTYVAFDPRQANELFFMWAMDGLVQTSLTCLRTKRKKAKGFL
jgi:hypothetical protein